MIERAWLRPRFAGFVDVQNRAAEVISRFLRGSISAGEALDELDRCLVNSQREE